MVYGDNRDYTVALIVADAEAVQSFAEGEGLGAHGLSELLEEPVVKRQFAREIERLSSELKGYEKVRDFAFAPEPFRQENGTLTPSLKLKRHAIVERWGGLLERLYPARTHGARADGGPGLTSAGRRGA
jgi:long-chain acyl-CoA synthetase